MSLRKKIGRVTNKRRVLDGAWLIVFLFLATRMIGGLIFGSSQVVQPLPLPELHQGNHTALEKYASELIMDEMDRNNIVGLSAAIIVGDRIVWSKGYGYADRETNKLATADTVYRVGSISKIPNAIAVLQYKAAGKVDLDAPIKNYIPELKVKSRFVTEQAFTPHLLMTHHSGLPSDIVKGMWGEKPAPFQSVVSLLAEEYVAYPPRTIHSYSNLGANLLGVMLERISGTEYETVMQESVLQPLEMVNSSYRPQQHILRKLSQGYNIKGQMEKDVEIRDVPAGNLYTSVNDLGKMMIMLLNDGVYGGKEVLPSGLVSKMFTAQNDAVLLDGNFKIGYEFFLKNPALAYVGDDFTHSGHMHLFHANVMGVKKYKIAVVVLANSAGADERVSLIAEQLLKGAVAVYRGLLPPTVKSAHEVLSLPDALQLPASYAGNYGTIIGMLEVQEPRKGSYVAKLEGNKVNLLPDKNGWLRPEYRLWGILPLPHPKLEDMRIAFRTINDEDFVFVQLGSEVPAVGKRISDYKLPEAWRNRQGVYRTNDEENQLLEIDSLELKVNKQGFLMMSLKTDTKEAQLGEVVLYPFSDREAVIYALGWRMMETISVRQEADGEKLIFSGISFTKQ
ncbi:MAG: class A beta-lactamase-related serine hydrolase [Negativicutes bacterium]|nr:class A beta-lactamase-related serine hydrolase [Negativicutes bacterium]